MATKTQLRQLISNYGAATYNYADSLRQFATGARSLMYRGGTFECPCCSGEFAKFLSAGEPPRTNAKCPRCESLERHRMIMLFLRNRTPFFQSRQRLLHIAPEVSLYRRFSKMASLDYVTADLNSPRARWKVDVTHLPFAENSFDCILCSHVLEHVTADRKAMSEFFRVLKPSGFAVLQVPVDEDRSETLEDPTVSTPKDRKRVFGQEDHVRVYGRDYADRLRQAGFELNIVDYCSEVGEDASRRFALMNGDYVYYCTKWAQS